MLPHLLAALLALADPPAVAKLIDQLGSPDFRAREAAMRELEVVGRPALVPLRAATKSADTEVARRAVELVGRITRRAENEDAIAPTLVQLKLADRPLSEVIVELEKQAGGKFTGLGASQLGTRVTVDTGGKVPFWDAVAKVCDAAGLDVATTAAPGPGVVPLRPRADTAMPSCVGGAVRVDVVPFPDAARPTVARDLLPVLLHVSAEPRLKWEQTTGVRVTKATAADGRELAGLAAAPGGGVRVVGIGGGNVVVDPDGGVNLVPQRPGAPIPAAFAQTPFDAVVRLKAGDGPAVTTLRALEGVIVGEVRVTGEVVAADLPAAGSAVAVDGKSGVRMKLGLNPDARGPKYGSLSVTKFTPVDGARRPAAADDLTLTDADGKPYRLRVEQVEVDTQPTPRGEETVRALTVRFEPTDPAQGVPVRLTVRGPLAKPVEVPFKLAGVPVTAGTGPGGR